MPTLREKIQASAAELLKLPPGRKPAEELARYKRFLKIESSRLKILHRAGAGGLEVCRARALVMDELIRHLLATALQFPEIDKLRKHPLAIIAYGGYGRGELSPCSDIDIMFLHDGALVTGRKPSPQLSAVMDAILYTFWDLGLKVGHSVRSVEDCVEVANQDMQTKTSLIESRLVVGDERLFKRLQTVIVAKAVRGHEDEYIVSRLKDQADRRAKHGNSACLQEPNLKNGCGGLRDIQNLIWMAFFKYRCRSLAEIELREAITTSERRQLESAYDFLLRVRNELHYSQGKALDNLSRNLQASVAHNLGFVDRSPSVRIEKFMRQLYTHFRAAYLITRNVEQRLALIPQERRLPTFREIIAARRREPEIIVDGFKITRGQIAATANRIFRDQPRRLMRVFLLAQQRGLKLHPDLVQLIRNSVRLIDRTFLRDEHVHQTFLEILNQRGNVAQILRSMHEVDVLGKYLPEFGKLTCLVQHEFYHQYAADEHTLKCIEELDAIWGASKESASDYAALLQGLPRPYVLYLALLLHDTGKPAHSGNHSETGSRLANTVAHRLGLDGSSTHALRVTIENHLVMAQVSQRRDLEDRKVIDQFVGAIKSREHLDILTLHTYADTMGTSRSLWNGFKDALLWTLYNRASALLEGGSGVLDKGERMLDREEVMRIVPRTFHKDEIDAHFANLPERYFQIHTAREIADDLARVHRFMHHQVAEEDRALEPVITWHNEPDRGYAVVHICTWDRAGLFSKIAGALTAAGLNILSAQIFSRADGIILDEFSVVEARTGKLPERVSRERFERVLQQTLADKIDLEDVLAKQKAASPLYLAADPDLIPTIVEFDNDASETRTAVDFQTVDRVGLLYAVSQALAEADLDISLAKISTEKGAAMDTFYVTELDGAQVTEPHRQRHVIQTIRKALAALDRRA